MRLRMGSVTPQVCLAVKASGRAGLESGWGEDFKVARWAFAAGHSLRAVTACVFNILPLPECHLPFVDCLGQHATSVTLAPFRTRYRGTPPINQRDAIRSPQSVFHRL